MDNFQEEVDQVDEAANVFAGRTQELEQEVKNIDLHLESNTVRCESIEKDRQRIVLDTKKLSERREDLPSNFPKQINLLNSVKQRLMKSKTDSMIMYKKLDLEEKNLF